jgi:hypothetical protein
MPWSWGCCWSRRRFASFRFLGVTALAGLLLTGGLALREVGAHQEIETLVWPAGAHGPRLTRLPGQDLAAVLRYLRDRKISAVWTTPSLVYPIRFESREEIAASTEIFGWSRNLVPDAVLQAQPDRSTGVFVVEAGSRFGQTATKLCQAKGGLPSNVQDFGAFAVLERRPR